MTTWNPDGSVLRSDYERWLSLTAKGDYGKASLLIIELLQQLCYFSALEKEDLIGRTSFLLASASASFAHQDFLCLLARMYGIRNPDADNTRRLFTRLEDLKYPLSQPSFQYLRA